MTGSPDHATSERLAWLSMLPVITTALYYLLPPTAMELTSVQFIPQVLGYLSFAIWARFNHAPGARLGLTPGPTLFKHGCPWGLMTGLALGCINAAVLLWIVPSLGADIDFLRETPHARLPLEVMLPWLIVLVACVVELNFRGFMLGRLLVLFAGGVQTRYTRVQAAGAAIGISAFTFAHDPFMVATFRHLHWIAVWDGIIWGFLWIHLRNLYVPIIAHAVEVIVMYSILKATLV